MLCMDRSTEAGRTSTSTTTWAKAPSGVPVGPNRPCRRWSDSISRFRASSAGWLTSLSSAKSSRAHPTAITASTSLRLLVVIVVIIDTDWYGLIWIDTDWYGLIRIEMRIVHGLIIRLQDDGLRTTPMNLLVGLEGLQMIPHPSSGSIPASKLVHIRWMDIKSLTHTKHHILVTILLANATKKLRFCVGTTR